MPLKIDENWGSKGMDIGMREEGLGIHTVSVSCGELREVAEEIANSRSLRQEKSGHTYVW
jgi:hypothetical protein